MVSRKSKWIRLVCLFAIPLVFAVGCAKREAQKELDAANVAKQEAQTAQAPGYVPDEFNDANRLLTQAQQAFEAGNYDEAIQNAQNSTSRFITATQNVGPIREAVNAKRAEIEDLISQADDNVQQARDAGQLTPEQIASAADQVTELRRSYVDEISTTVTNMDELNEFQNEVQQALDLTETLATAHLEPQAADAIQDTQDLIDRARELRADVDQPSPFAAVMDQFQQMQNLHQQSEWQQVIDLAPQVQQAIQQLITNAQEKQAGNILQETANQVAQANQLNVDVTAYRNAVTQAQAAIERGQTSLQNNQFGDAINASDEARSLLNQAYQSLGAEAQNLMDIARANLEQARGLEGAEFAEPEIAGVENRIAGVETQLNNQQFVAAYNNARQLIPASEQAIESARSGRARAELAKAEEPFNRLQSQGGAQYAPQAYSEARQAIERLRTQLEQGNYAVVEEDAPLAVERVNDAMMAIEEAAVEQIAQAQSAINDAQAAQAQEWVGMQYANALNLRSSAEQDLRNNNYISAIRKSEQAAQTAKEAESRSYLLQAEQNIRRSNEFLALARQANQVELSPLAYRNATQAVEQAERLVRSRRAEEAYEQSQVALQISERAFNNMVVTADEKVQAALEAGAMDYAQEDVQQALRLLNEAESAQQARNYAVANERSAQAIKLAESAAYQTWELRSRDLIANMDGLKEKLDFYQAEKRAPALYQRALSNLAEAKVKQLERDYAAAFQHADIARAAAQQVWDGYEADLNRVLQELRTTAEWMGTNALDEKGRTIKVDFLDEVAVLDQQVALRNWNEAYAAADVALAAAKRATDRMQSQNRQLLAAELKRVLQPYTRQNALSIVPEQNDQFKATLSALSKSGSKAPYGEAYQQYEQSLQTIDQLPTMIIDQAQQRTEEIAIILEQAQEAGVQRYYPDQFRQLSSDLQWLRNSIRGEDYKGIAERLERLEKEAPSLLANTQLAVRESEYLEALRLNLVQQNNLIQDFDSIAQMSADVIIYARLTEYKMDGMALDMYQDLQRNMSARTLLVNAEILEDRVKNMEPPSTLASVHKKAIKSFELFRKSAEGFEIYGNTDIQENRFKDRSLRNAYDYLKKTLDLNAELRFEIESHRKISPWDRIKWQIENWEGKFADFYFDYRTD